MFTLIFTVLCFMVFGKLFVFGLRAAWGLSKLIVTVFLFPIMLIGMLLHGFVFLAVIGLVVMGVVSLLSKVA